MYLHTKLHIYLPAYTPAYNRRNNIMKQSKILVYLGLTTSKVEFDFWYNKLCVRVASQFAKRLSLRF